MVRQSLHRVRNHFAYKRTHSGRSFFDHLSFSIILPLLLFCIAGIVATGSFFAPSFEGVPIRILVLALGASLARLIISYIISLVLAVPLALLAERGRFFESILLPIYDVLESIPVLAFFPVIILFFVHYNWLEAAAIIIIVLNMLWNIVFNLVGGLKLIPKDITAAASVFGYTGFSKLRTILLPALFPSIITGSILAVAEGWNMLIVAEVLHAYAPQSAHVADLFGIGSLLVYAASAGSTPNFLAAAGVIIAAVSFINLGLWQPLLVRSEHYKFE